MGKMAKKKKRRSKVSAQTRQNKFTMVAITCVVCMLFGILMYSGHTLQQRIVANDEKREQLAAEIEAQEKRTEEIGDLEAYMQTEEYIQSAAQEKLGLVKENEVIFKAEK